MSAAVDVLLAIGSVLLVIVGYLAAGFVRLRERVARVEEWIRLQNGRG